MGTGLLALLDDVVALAKVAAASLDDAAAQAVKASGAAAGVVIDDAAVTPRYVAGFAAERELPIIGRIARGSLKTKILFLLPAALLLSAFTPWAITPLLMIGGLFLCFEGYEKVQQLMAPHNAHANATDAASPALDPRAVEEKTVAGRTDFILSAEISPFVLLTRSPVSRPGRRSYLDDSSGSRSGECPAGSPRSTTTEAPGRTCASTMGSIVGIASASGSVARRGCRTA